MVPEDPLVVSISSNSLLHPDEITRKTFPTARRGLDRDAVRRYLESLSADLSDLLEREAQLRRRLAEAERRAAEPEIDEATLTRAVGSETARILQTAHQAARDVVANAELQARQLVEASEGLVAERTAAAEEEAAAILAGSEQEAALLAAATVEEATALRDSAQQDADELIEAARNEAAAILAATKQECRLMVREARELRHRVLNDLAERRRALRVQLAQLRTGRDSLVEVVEAVGDVVDQVRDRLASAEHEARVAAAQAGDRVEQYEQDDDLVEEPELRIQLGDEDELLALPSTGGESVDQHVAFPRPGGSVGGGLAGSGVEMAPLPLAAAFEAAPDERIALGQQLEGETTTSPAGESELTMALAVDEGLALELRGDDNAGENPAPGPVPHRSVGELFARLRANRGSGAAPTPVVESPTVPAPREGRRGTRKAGHEALSVPKDLEPAPKDVELGAVDVESVALNDPPETVALNDPPETVALTAPAKENSAVCSASTHAAALDDLDEDLVAGGEETAASARDGEEATSGADTAVAGLARRTELLAPVLTRLSRALKRALQDDQNELLDAIRHGADGSDLDRLLPRDAHRLRYEHAAALALSDAWTVGRLFMSPEDRESASDVAEKMALTAEEAGRELGEQLALELTGLLRHRLNESISTAGDLGGGARDVTGAAYREWKGPRVEAVAGDFAIAAFSKGAVIAGDGVLVKWIVDDDGQPCPDCDDNGLAGPQAAGEPFPTGQQHPPVHPGCRCLLLPA